MVRDVNGDPLVGATVWYKVIRGRQGEADASWEVFDGKTDNAINYNFPGHIYLTNLKSGYNDIHLNIRVTKEGYNTSTLKNSYTIIGGIDQTLPVQTIMLTRGHSNREQVETGDSSVKRAKVIVHVTVEKTEHRTGKEQVGYELAPMFESYGIMTNLRGEKEAYAGTTTSWTLTDIECGDYYLVGIYSSYNRKDVYGYQKKEVKIKCPQTDLYINVP